MDNENKAKNTFKTPNPGVNYKDGKLFIFMKDRIQVIKIDEYGPRAWEKTTEEPHFKISHIPDHLGSSAAKDIVVPPPEGRYIHWHVKAEMEFLNNHVPMPIIEQMAKFRRDAFQICGLAMRANGMELIQTNPAIAYITALNNVFIGKCKKPWRRARSLVDRKRKVILEKAGFEGSSSVVKILGKTCPDALSKKNVFLLRWLLQSQDDSIIKPLRFLPKINEPIIHILGNEQNRNILHFNLLEQIASVNSNEQLDRSWLIRDLFRLSRLLRVPLPRNIRTMDQVQRVHDQFLDVLYMGTEPKELKYHDFSHPTISNFNSDAFKIQHIKNTFELQDWGKKQHNCVLSYNTEISLGGCYIFRVITGEEEATLSLFKEFGDRLVIDQLLSTRNRPVKPATKNFVNLWLNGLGTYTRKWEDFPLPETKSRDLVVKPLDNIKFIMNLPFNQFKALTVEDITENQSVILYQLQKPENGVIALGQVNGQWDVILGRNIAGDDLQEKTYQLLEDWLWNNTSEGQARQMKFCFPDRNTADTLPWPEPAESTALELVH